MGKKGRVALFLFIAAVLSIISFAVRNDNDSNESHDRRGYILLASDKI